jgi:hypothetical protein
MLGELWGDGVTAVAAGQFRRLAGVPASHFGRIGPPIERIQQVTLEKMRRQGRLRQLCRAGILSQVVG